MYAKQHTTLAQCYAQGLADEKRVIARIAELYPAYETRPATKDENIFQDIDFWLGDLPVSIKAQHNGLRYGNIYFELMQQPRSEVANLDSVRILNQKKIEHNQLADLEAAGWVQSWYFNSQAKLYAILQGKTISIYNKSDILEFVEEHGFLRIKGLSKSRRDYLESGNYRYSNAICGYLDNTAIRRCTIQM